jgi:hypothetical protein
LNRINDQKAEGAEGEFCLTYYAKLYIIITKKWTVRDDDSSRRRFMEFFQMKEISIPIAQMVLLLLLSTGALFWGKLKLALLINYLFTLYWGYGINKDYLLGVGFNHVDGCTVLYIGFGLVVAALALISLIAVKK